MNSLLLALSGGAIAGICIGGIALVLIILLLILVPLKPYFTALFSGAHVSMTKLISLKFRKINMMSIIEAFILAKKSKLHLIFNDLEAHHIAGGSCKNVVTALIKAQDAGISLSLKQACAIDLSGQEILEVLDSVILPKTYQISFIKAITKDNYELEVNAKIAVKAKLEAIIGGLGENTLEDKVTKFIVAKISSLTDHKSANPYNLTDGILKNGLDAGNAYQLVSVDVVSINISRDIGAELAEKELERVKIQAQIQADREKNQALIEAEQMKVRTQEMKTAVLEAEAEVPRAIAEAIRDGRLSVMDYYKLMNLQADTAMRRALINKDEEPRG